MKCPHCHCEILKQKTLVVEYKGEKISLRELSRLSGFAYSTLQNRYDKGLRGEQLVAAIDMRRTRKTWKRNKPEQPRSEISGLMRQFMSGGSA